MARRYVSARADVVRITLNPQAGHVRRAEFICKLPRQTTNEVLEKLGTLLGDET
jgi:hypothetical protein